MAEKITSITLTADTSQYVNVIIHRSYYDKYNESQKDLRDAGIIDRVRSAETFCAYALEIETGKASRKLERHEAKVAAKAAAKAAKKKPA